MTPDDMEGRLLHYLSERAKMRQIDGEIIHGLNVGDLSEAVLTVADLRALLLDYQERGRALERLVESVAYVETDGGRRSYGLKPCFGTAYQEARATLKGKSHD